ncbi:LipA and NB-ARC domain-containing protein [Histoplasma capsulatum H143]|uniref:LipA and NB-ARC domain-containing protein n=1 Tax=Ajellomyces capsulatus (strain H143) TaxID=544712 RepID=C6HRM6_AJECH|nr:LipA and NB-ARC domain-containing protein [Histoplasma capsulatum H143]
MGSNTAKRLNVKEFGLTEVYRCAEPLVPQVDIVFVHGLNGTSYNTWATKKPEVFWPGDLLPHTLKGQNVRILTYGYDANVTSFARGTSKERLHNHAEHLAGQLIANRNLQDAVERPIIFVCHSLGGIVVKKTLLYCEHLRHPRTQHIRSTYVSTYAILFMGTPHNGSDLANLGTAIQTIFSLVPRKLFDTTPTLLKTLRPDNEILQNVNRQFAEIMGRYRIYFFHESKPMDLKGTRKFIVEESSAAPVIEGVERMGIEADHTSMCRFESEKSPGYEAVAEAILRYTREAPGEIANRWAQEHRARRNNMREEAERLRQNSELIPITRSQLMSSAELPPPQETGEPLLVAPPGFHPNSIFVGMEKELEELHNRLFRMKKRAEDVVSVLIYGGSGSGKTHLARQYVFKQRTTYTGGIFWIDARSRESCCQCFWDIAERVSSTLQNETPDPDWRDRDNATGKAIEKFRIKPQTTDKRLAEPYRGIMADLQNNQHMEAINLITVLSFFGHDVPVGMIHLGRKALFECGVEIRAPEEDGSSGRHIDNTFAILIRYGLLERALDPYFLNEQSPIIRRSTELSDSQPTSELDSSQTSGSQNTSSIRGNSSIDVVKIHTVVQTFFRDELSRLGVGAFAWWLIVSTRLFLTSYANATARIRTQQAPGLVKDFGQYETHASVLLGFYKQLRPHKGNPDLPPDLVPLNHALSQVKNGISEEIKHRSPVASQQLIKQQKSIFDRTSSTSSMPDTPTSGSSRFTWEMDVDHEKTHSPIEYISSRQSTQHFPSTISQNLPLPVAEDQGYESDLEGSRTAPAMSPVPSQTTEVPTSPTVGQEEGDWKVVAKPTKPKSQSFLGSVTYRLGIRRIRGQRNLGSYRPVHPVVSVSGVHGQGSSSRLKINNRKQESPARSHAEASLAAMHQASAASATSRGEGVRNMNFKATQKENAPTYANVVAGKRPSASSSPIRFSPPISWGSDNQHVENPVAVHPRSAPSHHGWSPRSSSDQLTNSYHSEFGTGSSWKRPEIERVATPPSRFHSRHPSHSSEGSSGNILGLQDATPQHLLTAPASRPLPYEADIAITRPRYSSVIVPPPATQGLGVASYPNAGAYGNSMGQPIPTGYSSQPMSRNGSAQSSQSLHTEPTRIPPKFSPSLGKRRSSPLVNFAQSDVSRLDTRSPQMIYGRGGGTAIVSSPSSPNSFEATAMSRASSGPGMMVDSGDGVTRSFVEFSRRPSMQHIRFGEHEPINIADARMRSGVYENPTYAGQGVGAALKRSTSPPYPDQNLMPSASDDNKLQSLIGGPLENIGNFPFRRRFRSGSSPARPDMDGYLHRQ